jgi:hypothetical protein
MHVALDMKIVVVSLLFKYLMFSFTEFLGTCSDRRRLKNTGFRLPLGKS